MFDVLGGVWYNMFVKKERGNLQMQVSKRKMNKVENLEVGNIISLSYQMASEEKDKNTSFAAHYKEKPFKTLVVKGIGSEGIIVADLETKENIFIEVGDLFEMGIPVVLRYFRNDLNVLANNFSFTGWRSRKAKVRRKYNVKYSVYKDLIATAIEPTKFDFVNGELIVSETEVKTVALSGLLYKGKVSWTRG